MKLRRRRVSERLKMASKAVSIQNVNKKSKKRLKRKKQKLNKSKCVQALNEPSVKQTLLDERTHSRKQNLLRKGRLIKSSNKRKRKNYEVKNVLSQNLTQNKTTSSKILQKKKLLKTRRLQENKKSGNAVKTSIKIKKKRNVSKLKRKVLRKALNQNNELVMSCLNEFNKLSINKAEKKWKRRLSSKQTDFVKTDTHLVPCNKLNNQEKDENKRGQRKIKKSSLIKSKSKTNTLRENKKDALAHEIACQFRNNLPGSQKTEHLKGQPVKKTSENGSSEDEESDKLPLIHFVQNRIISWPNSKFTSTKEQSIPGLEKISEKKKVHIGQKNVKNQKMVQKDEVKALEQNIKDLKAQNSRLLNEINAWQRGGKEEALVKHHVISSKCCCTQTDVETVAVETQTDEIFFKQQPEGTTVKMQDGPALTDNQAPSTIHDTDNKDGVFSSNPDSKDLDAKMDMIDVEENIIEYSVSMSENEGENNTESADPGSPQKEVKNPGFSQNLEPLWNPQSSRAECQCDMKCSNLVYSEEEPTIIEIECDEPGSVSQTTTRQKSSHPSETVKVEKQRDDHSLQLSNNCNSQAIHQHTAMPSCSNNSAVPNGQAAVLGSGWLPRTATYTNGYRLLYYVRPSYENSITNKNFPLSIQQDVVNLAESICNYPVQQISQNVFLSS